ncbi:UNVERIFIED_CONTAM: hypothetical protein FKN15_026821 [Acipenser sinensis]
MSGSPGGAKQESGRTTVPADAATWDPGPAMGGPDTKDGCLGARVKGSYPQAPDCCPGVVVGAVVEAVSSSLAIRAVAPPLALRTAVTPLWNSSCSSLGRQLLHLTVIPPSALRTAATPLAEEGSPCLSTRLLHVHPGRQLLCDFPALTQQDQ